MSKLPAFQFYPGDYLKDPSLSMCSPATRGIWVDLLCAFHEAGRSGQIAATTEQFARICRCSPAEFTDAIAELKSTKAADIETRNGLVTVINRRMKREANERLITKERVAKFRSNASVTEVKRECNTPSSSSVSISSSKQPEEKPKEEKEKKQTLSVAPTVRAVFAYWQSACNHSDAKLTPKRERVIGLRLKEGYTLEDLKSAIDGCRASPFHQGQNDRHTVYDDIELICRNGEKVEHFKQLASEDNSNENNSGKTNNALELARKLKQQRNGGAA